MKSTMRRLCTVVLVLMFALALVPQFVTPAHAAEGTTVYLKPDSAIWATDGAWFAAYYWIEGGTNGWVKLTDDDGNGYYVGTIPAGYTNVIFTRNDPSKTDLGWGSKWNQTADLTLSSGNNCYTITGWNDNLGMGAWSAYTPAPAECVHSWSDGKCSVCHFTCDHDWVIVNGACPTCGMSDPTHTHSWDAGKCSDCDALQVIYVNNRYVTNITSIEYPKHIS